MDSRNSLGYLLQHTSTIMQRQADQLLQERLGIGMAQYRILMTLQERPQVQQRFLADSLGQTEASISRQVKLLLERNLLVVQTNPQNRREHVTVLTQKGVKLAHAAQEALQEYHAPAFDALSEKEQEHLAEILQHLHLHCCQEGKPYACDLPWFSMQTDS